MTQPKVTIAPLDQFRPQAENANLHTARGEAMLRDSIQRDGWIDAETVAADGEHISGSSRYEQALATGFEDAIVIDSDGTRPIIVRRTDIPTARHPRAKRLGVAANRAPQENLHWSGERLAALQAEDDAILAGLFREDELARITGADPVDPAALWQGMPEFEHEDQTDEAAFTIRVFLRDADDLAALGRLLGKDLTGRKYVWFGKQPQGALHEVME